MRLLLRSSVPSSTKGALVDDFKVMLTRKESFTCLAKAVAILVIFSLGAAAGLWAAAGPREYINTITVYFTGRGGGAPVCCRPDPDPDFAEFIAPTRLMHNMTDEQLFWRASMVPAAEYPFDRTPKVAFMFLAGTGVLPLAPLWERFFRGQEGRFSVYVHAPPGVAINVSEDSPLYQRQIPSQETSWGSVTLMDAEKRLLANALLDFSNERFVLLSESCIPVHNFSTVYDYLVDSHHSFVEVYDRNSKQCRGRYSRRMAPSITRQQWRKGSQWFEMDRDVARSLLTDTKYYPLFQRYCRPTCYPDEHYAQTFVHMRHGERNSNRTVTYVDWSRGGPHPAMYGARNVSPELIRSIRMSAEPCLYNGRLTSTCYLFARKFTPDALAPLLEMSSTVMQY
ncbi:hypothetical protein PR202_gb04038 [Eleusine coracana subsp. coracana]|uniref:Core-2/I-branching beta-16-N-acetylglucosaminyltransferase family protein n=1 Tax=Eleusine coracana subsp. coracana TaxID=191504 RepID=A0AAV5E2Y6_ELECO|nr:hypothetical protein QOZ80_1BG0091680 [Eleusine coracana subsp. coracana]GJN17000.1 hypothetical protein PR202_gb04038 [Eleusine coracana subsp. coracana]